MLRLLRNQDGSAIFLIFVITILLGTIVYTMMDVAKIGQKDVLFNRLKHVQENAQIDISDAFKMEPTIVKSLDRFIDNRALLALCDNAGTPPPGGFGPGATQSAFKLVSMFESTAETLPVDIPPERLLGAGDFSANFSGFGVDGQPCTLFSTSPACLVQAVVWIDSWSLTGTTCTVTLKYEVRLANKSRPAFSGSVKDYNFVLAIPSPAPSLNPYPTYQIGNYLGPTGYTAKCISAACQQ